MARGVGGRLAPARSHQWVAGRRAARARRHGPRATATSRRSRACTTAARATRSTSRWSSHASRESPRKALKTAGSVARMSAPTSEIPVAITVNGVATEHDVEARTLLVQYLREVVGLTGTNIGCDSTSCGACTVLLDGESVKSCTVLAAQADGARGHHHRRSRRRRRAAPDAGGVPRAPRAAVRLLHAGHGDGGGLAGAGARRAHRGRGAQRSRGQPLPLHRLPQHRGSGRWRARRELAGSGK